MAHAQQRVDVALVIDAAVLVQHAGGAGQAQRGQAIVLRHHDVARRKQIDQSKVRAVRAAGDGDGAGALAAHLMRIVAHQHHLHPARPGCAQGDLHHRAGVRVYQQACAAHWGVTCKSTGL